jgi:hypothetical protein
VFFHGELTFLRGGFNRNLEQSDDSSEEADYLNIRPVNKLKADLKHITAGLIQWPG